ncbi:MAG: UxaA family hydrolase, partial [Verrucomicrobia bacterium]|nr:UxaA family hydrolase [Verrucomicrobiota bacterium]
MSVLRFEDCGWVLHPADTVAVLKRPLLAGTELAGDSVRIMVHEAIPAGHKVALCDVADGQPVFKYGQIIGFARGAIAPGDHVHTHNLVIKDFARDAEHGTAVKPIRFYPPEQMRSFPGYARPDGRVGTRNYVGIVSVVNCSASVARGVQERVRTEEVRLEFPSVDGVVAFTHKSG